MRILLACASAACVVAACALPCFGAPGANLTLRRAMLTQGGVGYFEYEATIDGAGVLGLDVPRDQVSDILKSLVVLDPAGSVARVELPSEDGGDAALARLPVPRAAFGRARDLLNALQGVTVEVSGPAPMTGRILRAEAPTPPVAPPPGPAADPGAGKTRVTLLTDSGLRQFVLEDVPSVQIVDPVLRERLQAALDGLRGEAAAERRHLSLHLEGSTRRAVRVGVVVGAPLWKTAYRLVLSGTEVASARLQGWAVLENATLTDWTDIALSLVAGNPVTFRQALYRTYLVERPEVPVDVLRRLVPDIDTRAAAMAPQQNRAAPKSFVAPAPVAAPMMAAAMAPPSAPAELERGGVDSVFTLPRPFSLAAGSSAAVPFLDRAVPASRIGLLGFGHPHPLAALRVANDSGVAWPPGAVTTYDDTGFTGDARLGPFPDGESRVLSFAEDAAVTADWRTDLATTLTAITAARGVVRLTQRERTTIVVTLHGAAGEPRRLLVELPRAADATLSTEPVDLPVERTATMWRVEVMVPAGERRVATAHSDRLLNQETILTDDPDSVARLLGEQALPAEARAALRRLADLRADAGAKDASRDRLRADREAIEKDEQRLRANLGAVVATDSLRGRLLRDLDAAETRLATVATALDRAERAAANATDAFADAVARLEI